MNNVRGNLTVVVCAAGPAGHVDRLIKLAQASHWAVSIVATPSATAFIDSDGLARLTGQPVRSQYREPGTPRVTHGPADAIIVAPATFNTINKLANGVSDNYALGVLTEHIGRSRPTVVLPFINTALANRRPLRESVGDLRSEGVHVLLGDDGFTPHPPGSGNNQLEDFPWHVALAVISGIHDRTLDK